METPIKKRKIQVETPGTVFNEEGDEALFQDRYDLVNVQNSPLFVKDMKDPLIRKNKRNGFPMYYRVIDKNGHEIIDERTGRHLLVPVHTYFHGNPDDPMFADYGLTYADVYYPRYYQSRDGTYKPFPMEEMEKRYDPIWKGDLWRECYYANDLSMGTNLIGDNIKIFRDVKGEYGRKPGENVLGMARGTYVEAPNFQEIEQNRRNLSDQLEGEKIQSLKRKMLFGVADEGIGIGIGKENYSKTRVNQTEKTRSFGGRKSRRNRRTKKGRNLRRKRTRRLHK